MITDKKDKKLVFVVGSGRSGTTLLRNILERRPDIGVSPELKFFDYSASIVGKFWSDRDETSRGRAIDFFIEKITSGGDPIAPVISDGKEEIKRALTGSRDEKDFFLKMLEFTTSRPNADILVEKTPSNVFYLDKIFQMFPQSKIIHMVRDSREFAASACKRGWFKNVTQASVFWNESLRHFESFSQRPDISRENLTEILYEDLTDSPESAIKKMFLFLEAAPADDSFFEDLKTINSFSSFFENRQAGIYKSKHADDYFSEEDKEKITNFTRRYLREKKYKADGGYGSWAERPDYLFELAKFRTRLLMRKRGVFHHYERLRGLVKNLQ